MNETTARITAEALPNTRDMAEMCRLEMRDFLNDVAAGRPISISRAEAVERYCLRILDELSPEIRVARALEERYRACPKIGGR